MQESTQDELRQENKEAAKKRYRQWYAKYHPHPTVVHFPIALHYFSGFIDLLFFANPSTEYAATVFLSFFVATVMGLIALITGVFSWWINYNLVRSKLFVVKFIGAILTFLVGLVPLIQKFRDPDVPFSHGIDGWLYHGVIFITVILVTIVAYYGGKLTWRAKI